MALCQYKNMFGAPGTGAHKYRFLGVAIVDTVATIVAAVLIWAALKYYQTKSLIPIASDVALFFTILIILFVLGEFMHWLFCVDTAVMRALRSFT